MTVDADIEKTTKLIGTIREAVGLLAEIAAKGSTIFVQDRHLQGSAKYNFIVAIEAAMTWAVT